MFIRNAVLASVMVLTSVNANAASQTVIVKNQLNSINQFATSQGLTFPHNDMIDDMPQNDSDVWTLIVSPKSETMVHIVCDGNCKQIDADAYDDSGDLVVSTDSPSQKSKDIRVLPIQNTSSSSQVVVLRVKMKKCSASSCIYGISVAERPL